MTCRYVVFSSYSMKVRCDDAVTWCTVHKEDVIVGWFYKQILGKNFTVGSKADFTRDESLPTVHRVPTSRCEFQPRADDFGGLCTAACGVTKCSWPWEIDHWPSLLNMCPQTVKYLSTAPKDMCNLCEASTLSAVPLLYMWHIWEANMLEYILQKSWHNFTIKMIWLCTFKYYNIYMWLSVGNQGS